MLTRNQFLTYCMRNNITCVYKYILYDHCCGSSFIRERLTSDARYGIKRTRDDDDVYEEIHEYMRPSEFFDRYESNPCSCWHDPETHVLIHMRSKCPHPAIFDTEISF